MSARRDAVVTAAGPAANLLTAPLLLLLPLPLWITESMALIMTLFAVSEFAPGFETYDTPDDGTRLFQLRARLRAEARVRELLEHADWSSRLDAADIIIDGYALDVREAIDCMAGISARPEVLIALSRQPWTLPEQPETDVLKAVQYLSDKLLVLAGLPADVVDLAADRVEWVLGQLEKNKEQPPVQPYNARHTLAVARLRQGRPEEVRWLCAGALAADLKPADRATVLATVAMARHALLLSGQQALDEAMSLDPDANLVAEAVRVLGAPAGAVADRVG